jgi:hypothetical protein
VYGKTSIAKLYCAFFSHLNLDANLRIALSFNGVTLDPGGRHVGDYGLGGGDNVDAVLIKRRR